MGDDEARADWLREMYDYYDVMGRELPELRAVPGEPEGRDGRLARGLTGSG